MKKLKVWGEYTAAYVDNYDGDSITLTFSVWEDVWTKQAVRLGGIDTPEVGWRAKCDREKELGEKAKALVSSRLHAADEILLRVYEREKFGRLLVDIIVDGVDLAGELIKAKLARPYYGGKRSGWC